MHICLAYDISNNRLRLRMSKHCKRVGLLRLQRSLFVGEISAFDLAELEREYRPVLAQTDKFAVLQLEKADCQALLQQSSDELLRDIAEPFANWYL